MKSVNPETASVKTVDLEAASVRAVDPETASVRAVDPETASVKAVHLRTESVKGIQRKIESWSTQFFLQVGEIYQSASSRAKSHLFNDEKKRLSVGDYTQLVTGNFKRPQVGERRSEKLFNERGDVPGWVLVVLMTTGLVTAIWTIAAPRLSTILKNSLDAMNGIR